MKNKKILLKLITFLLLTLSANSSELDVKTFGTLSGVYNDNKNYIYRRDIFQKDGSSDDISLKTDSVIGLQTALHLNENFSVLIQGIVRNNYNDTTQGKIDWGYLRYDSGENIIVKLGRIRTPYYKNSANLNIGYSNLMIREAVEVYGQVPFSSFNGAEITYSNIIYNYFYTLQASYGKEDLTVPYHSLDEKVHVKIEDLYALNLTFGTTALQARATYLSANITASSPMLSELFGGLRQFGFNELANQYEFNKKRSQYLSFGIFLDYENIIFSSEYGQRRIPSFFADVHGYYATLAYSFDNFIPFITYARSKMDKPTYDANTVSADLNNLLRTQNLAQTSNTIGIKYYINKNLDLKLQYEHIIPQGAFGSYHLSSLQNSQKMNVLSLALDFIF